MRIIQLIFFLLFNCFAFAQSIKTKINWTDLTGNWNCTKVVLIQKGDTIDESKQYLPYTEYYYVDLNYKEAYPASNSTTIGKYSIDKPKSSISYKNLVMTVKFPGGKVAVPDNVFKTGKQELKVLSLTNDILILYQPKIINSEAQGNYIFYMKKVL